MKTAIIVSDIDTAGMNIRNHLLDCMLFEENGSFEGEPSYSHGDLCLYTVSCRSIDFEIPEEKITADRFIFATKHESKAGVPTLSTHVPGNFDKADLGGQEKMLCVSMPAIMKHALILLEKKASGTGYDVVQEATHHGPYTEKPVMFIEIGSKEEQWNDPEAGKIIGEVIKEMVTSTIPEAIPAVGIGGPHTLPNFKKVFLGSDYAIGHHFPKYALDTLDQKMLKQAVEKTPGCKTAIVDWKGVSGYKERIVQLCSDLGLALRKTSEF